MRWTGFLMMLIFASAAAAGAAEGKIYKVLPQYLDLKGRTSISPSLYDRDAYQAKLRRNPAQCSGLAFKVQWRAKKATGTEPLKLQVEMRGISEGDLPRQKTIELAVQQRHWFSHWAAINFGGEDYKKFGEVTAWRVTLWDGGQLLGEQKSFLW
jgi:hypothetical protein